MARRAGVSETVFLDIFPNVEECYRRSFYHGLDRLSRTVAEASAREQAWLERVRSGLVALLGFFDDEPSWARLLLLETPLDGALTFECRQQLHYVLSALLVRTNDASDGDGAARKAKPLVELATLTGELVVGGVFSVIRTTMLENDECKLVELAPALMAFIVAPYLGKAAAQAELEGRPCGVSEGLANARKTVRPRATSQASELPIRATHRTTLVLRAIAQSPYSNNREIAQAAGLADEGQASKLLARLERQGMIANVGVGAARGEPNAWLLTAEGKRVVELLAESRAARRRRGGSRGIRGAA